MDRDEPAEDRFDAGVFETRLADHAFEAGHVGEAADRFDEIAIAVLVIGNRLADLRHQLVRIEASPSTLKKRDMGNKSTERKSVIKVSPIKNNKVTIRL